MKTSSPLAALSLVSAVHAFPSVFEAIQQGRPIDAGALKRQEAPTLLPHFDAASQFVPTDGEHAFVAPDLAGGDARGPCPGLNAMANHGYIPHNGVGSNTDFIQGTLRAFGMSVDLSGFLTVLGSTFEGNDLAWSIGGPSKAAPPVLPGLGQPQGLSGSHNVYEADNSPGRGDLYQYGNDFVLQMDQYQQLYDMGKANGGLVDLDVLTEFRSRRWDQQVARNPYFFNGPFTGVFVQPAAYTFIYRFMSNKSAEHPTGELNLDIMNSFFGVEEVDGKLQKINGGGHERFPENWYKRAVGDEYSIPFFQEDLLLAAAKHPKFLSVGGNTGKVNTFTGVSPEDVTGGVFNGATLMEGNNAACYASQFLLQTMPDQLKCSSVLSDITGAMSKVTQQLGSSFSSFSCPQLRSIDNTQFDKFPGYTGLNCKTGEY